MAKTALMKQASKKQVVMKKVMKQATTLKKPSGQLSVASLKKLGEATLDDKIALYQKKGADNIDAFLSTLSKEHRESLWQRFKYARQENMNLAKQYDTVATGPRSSGAKKGLLNIFIKLGQSCKGQPYVEAMTQLTHSKSSSTSKEWVPLNMIQKKYGLAELVRRVQKGSVQVRSDPNDPEEYEFQDVRKVDTDLQCETELANVQKKDKIAFEDYIKAKASSSLHDCHDAGTAAHVFLNKLKAGSKSSVAALNNMDDAEEEDDADDDDDVTAKKKAMCEKAEQLTQFKKLGDKGKTAAQRVDDMLTMMNELLKENPKTKDKALYDMIKKRVLCLQNLKKDKKLCMDTCKAVLLDAAQTIKKVNKLS